MRKKIGKSIGIYRSIWGYVSVGCLLVVCWLLFVGWLVTIQGTLCTLMRGFQKTNQTSALPLTFLLHELGVAGALRAAGRRRSGNLGLHIFPGTSQTGKTSATARHCQGFNVSNRCSEINRRHHLIWMQSCIP